MGWTTGTSRSLPKWEGIPPGGLPADTTPAGQCRGEDLCPLRFLVVKVKVLREVWTGVSPFQHQSRVGPGDVVGWVLAEAGLVSAQSLEPRAGGWATRCCRT